jgi:hypothetical protein
MGFKPQGMPSSFNRSTAGSGQGQRAPYRRCKLIKIDSYDLGARQMHGTDENGAKLMVQIRPETIARNVERAKTNVGTMPQAPKWEGYLIDSRMEESLPVGQRIVIEKAEQMRSIQHNGQTVGVYMSDRIINIADPSPEKTFEGLFSISTYQNHVFHVQRWEEKAVSIDDPTQIERVRQALEEGSKAFLNKELRPHLGVQFRVVLPAPSATEKCPVIDTSPTFDWIPRQFDSNNNEIAAGHPLDGDKFMELLFDETEGYMGYFKSTFPPEQYPGAFIEVCPYINYRAGPRSRYMAIPEKQFDPIYKLANTQTRLAIGDENFVQGKNMAVQGVLQLSSDQVDLTTRTFKSRNIAVRLHATGPMGHVHAWIRTSTGLKTQPHEALKQVPVQRAGGNDKLGAPAPAGHGGEYSQDVSRASAAHSGPVSAPPASAAPVSNNPMDAKSAFEDDWGMDEDEPFGEVSNDAETAKARQRLAEASRNMD